MPALEWVQCTSCGRRHRWQVELANAYIACSCGAEVHMPDLKAFEAAARDPDGTKAGSSATLITLEDRSDVEAGRLSAYQGKGPGLWGMSAFGTFIFWFSLALLGFFFAVHAAIVQVVWSYVGTALFVPVPTFKARQWYKRWLRGRTLTQAMDDQLNRGA
jgi:hypothetical protein